MPRTYKRKNEKPDEANIKNALEEIKNGAKVNTMAEKYNISRGLLRCRMRKKEEDRIWHHNQIFSHDQEQGLVKYLIKAANMFNGLSRTATQRLAYEYAMALRRKVPDNWRGKEPRESGSASREWLFGFMARHPTISLRKPQATSLGRATAFNQHNIDNFFTKLKGVIERFNIEPANIWNMDETALTTVQKPIAVLARRGIRNLGSTASAERGVLVTLALAVSAGEVCLPPFYIFPRKKFRNDFLAAAGSGAGGAANPSGWMTGEQFLKFLNHFKKYARATKDSNTLLILDNHESHVTIAGLHFSKENGIIVLSLPPHTSHKLQPLDRSVFGPIKKFYNAACNSWMRMPQNAARTITMHDIPGIAREPIQKGASMSNIQSGFRATGICPLNENIFTEIDFLPSEITNREAENIRPTTPGNSCEEEENNSTIDETIEAVVTVENIRPFAKAPPRKPTNRGRKRRKSAILTDEDEMEALRLQQQTAAEEKAKQVSASAARAEARILKKVAAQKENTEPEKNLRRHSKRGRPKKVYVEKSDEESDFN